MIADVQLRKDALWDIIWNYCIVLSTTRGHCGQPRVWDKMGLFSNVLQQYREIEWKEDVLYGSCSGCGLLGDLLSCSVSDCLGPALYCWGILYICLGESDADWGFVLAFVLCLPPYHVPPVCCLCCKTKLSIQQVCECLAAAHYLTVPCLGCAYS